jgi:hypothetical protein
MKETWFNGKRPKSPFIPLYERGKTSMSFPLCKGETEGILMAFEPSFLAVKTEKRRGSVLSLDFRPADTQFLHSRSQSARVQAKDRCGSILPVDTPARF